MKQTRRTFMKNTAVASAAVMTMPSAFANSVMGKPKIGLGMFTVRDQMAADPKGTLEKIAKIGYKRIEPFGFDGEKVFGMTGKEFKAVIDDLGLEYYSGHVNPPVFFEKFEQSLEFMNTVDQKYAAFPWVSPEERTIDHFKEIAEALNKCGEQAKSAGVTICYHNHDFEFMEIDGQLPMDILTKETDADLVKLELDLYWAVRAGVDPIEFFAKNEGRIPLWHVKDMADTKEKGFAEVGEGTIDFKSIFAKKKLSGMKAFFVEQDQSDDPLKSIEISYKNLSEKILG